MSEQSNDGTVTEGDKDLAIDLQEGQYTGSLPSWQHELTILQATERIRQHVAAEVRRETEALLEKQATRDRFNIKCHRDQVDALRAECERLKAEAVVLEGFKKERNNALNALENLIAATSAIGTKAHCTSKAGPTATPTLDDAWHKFDLISVAATEAVYAAKHADGRAL